MTETSGGDISRYWCGSTDGWQTSDCEDRCTINDLVAALESFREGECWCSEATRIRDYYGNHSPRCIAAQDALP